MEKIPVNIISGFLGSGKTTAIIRLLNEKPNDENWAVIINEFGKISIDGQTLRSSNQAGKVFEVSGGCICCSAKGYFKENLESILLEGNYSRIIIEPTGLGGIDMVSEIVNTIPELSLMPVICLVDITILENPRLQQIPIYRNQISKSDIVVFSKCDLLTDSLEQDRLINKFKTQFPDKQYCFKATELSQFAAILNYEPELGVEENKYSMISPIKPELKDGGYQQMNYSFGSEVIFDTAGLTRFLELHPCIIRAKGHILTDRGWNLMNFTLSGCTLEPCEVKTLNEIILITEVTNNIGYQNFEAEIKSTMISPVQEFAGL